MMKYFIITACTLASVVLCSCSNNDIPEMPAPTAQGIYTDPRDGETYRWVQYGNLQWMAQNYRYDTGIYDECRIYIDPEEWDQYGDYEDFSHSDVPKYGMYYTLEGALKACPDGWRLPTEEDWEQLECMLGMNIEEAQQNDWRGNVAQSLIQTKDRKTYLELLLAGYVTLHTQSFLVDGSKEKGAFGYYWTSTQDESKSGRYFFFRKFAYNRNEICRQSMESTNQYLSVRYVRDVE